MPTPAIAGAAHVVQRLETDELDRAAGPIELMTAAAKAAAADTGVPALLGQVQWIGVAGGIFRHTNPAEVVTRRIGVPGAATALSGISGTAPQELLALAASRIQRGELEVALVLGGEARSAHQRLSRAGRTPAWDDDPGRGEPEQVSGLPDEMIDEVRSLGAPAVGYALFEDRLRVVAGRSVADQRRVISELWSRFSRVAAANPYAWDRTPRSAEEIGRPTPTNRLIAFPYTKAMVANNTVDMASAFLVCSAEAARRAGVTPDRLVYPLVETSAHETWKVVNRDRLDRTPALAAAAAEAFRLSGTGIAGVAHIDLYACFPSIVEMSTEAIGIDPGRDLTLTGGLGFAGGAIANSVGHSIAAMVERVRGGGTGLVHANGGNATKHSVALYSASPPEVFVRRDCQELVPAARRAEIPSGWEGPVEVEAATVVHDREGPVRLVAAVLDTDGRRAITASSDAALMAQVEDSGLAGAGAALDAGSGLRV